MKQGVLPFQYEEEKSSTGMTALSGLPAYPELAHAAGLRSMSWLSDCPAPARPTPCVP